MAAEPKWDVLWTQLKSAASDLGISQNHAAAVYDLWRTCPDCVPQDGAGNPNAFVVRAYLKDVDAGTEVVCSCEPYVATSYAYEVACAFQAKVPQAFAAPCGYGWVKHDEHGNPIFVTLNQGGSEQPPIYPPPPDEIPDTTPLEEPEPLGSKSNWGPLFLGYGVLIGLATIAAFALPKAKKTSTA